MAFARAAFWRTDDGDAALRSNFWRKTQSVAARIPFADELLATYYCAFDRNTPLKVKATLLGALAYFVLPVDSIPDMLPMLGFTDDGAVLVMAIKLVAGHIRPEHRDMARDTLAELKSRR